VAGSSGGTPLQIAMRCTAPQAGGLQMSSSSACRRIALMPCSGIAAVRPAANWMGVAPDM
jgi:hypothetical protein